MNWDLRDNLGFDNSPDMTKEKGEKFMEYIIDKKVNYFKSPEHDILFTTVLLDGLTYNCVIYLYEKHFTFSFFSTKYDELFTQPMNMSEFDLDEFKYVWTPFLNLDPFKKRTDITTKKQKIPPLKSTSFETILELMYRIYCFFNIEANELVDAANVSCPNYKTYSLRLYRILATQKPVDDISIYRKKFGYVYAYDIDQNQLDFVRNSKMKDVFDLLSQAGGFSRIKLVQTYSSQANKTVYEFFSEMCPLEQKGIKNCEKCQELLHEIHSLVFTSSSTQPWIKALKNVYINSTKLIREKTCHQSYFSSTR